MSGYVLQLHCMFTCNISLKESDVKYVPCSGLAGENLTRTSVVETFKQWYSGPTLLDIIGKSLCLYSGIGIHVCVSMECACLCKKLIIGNSWYVHTYVRMYEKVGFIPDRNSCYVRTCLHTYVHTHIRMFIPTYVHTYICTYLHMYIPTYVHTYICTYLHMYIPIYYTSRRSWLLSVGAYHTWQ